MLVGLDCFKESVYQLDYADNVFECDTTLYAIGGCVGGIVIIIFIIVFLKLWRDSMRAIVPDVSPNVHYGAPRNPAYQYGLNLPSHYIRPGTHDQVWNKHFVL